MPSVAIDCIRWLQEKGYTLDRYELIVEPSAGSGSFFDLLPHDRRRGYDIDPKHPDVIQQDFLQLASLPGWTNTMVVGNPPFGKNANLAIKFFNHAATLNADVIAFILPRTFRKISVTNKLNLFFHLVDEILINPESFLLDGKPYKVPCVFQIWERRLEKREKVARFPDHPDLVFTTKSNANTSFQRVGVRAGTIREGEDILSRAKESHLFLNVTNDVRETLKQLDYDSIKHDTAGNPSISRSELNRLYSEFVNREGNG